MSLSFSSSSKSTSLSQDPNSLQTNEALLKKYNDLKFRYNRLKEHVQAKDQAHKTEIEKMRVKIEENKNAYRKIEDENINMSFKISSLKEKTFQQAKELQEMKVLVKKLYKKYKDKRDKTRGSTQNSPDSVSSKIGRLGENSLSVNSDDLSVHSARSAETHSPLNAKYNTLNTATSVENFSTHLEQSPIVRKKSLFARINDPNQPLSSVKEEPDYNTIADRSTNSPAYPLESRVGNDPQESHEETKESAEESKDSSEDRISIPNFFMNQRFSIKANSRQITTVNLDPRAPSTGQTISNGEYIRKFNRLSTIVALGVRPEIAIENEESPKAPGSPLEDSQTAGKVAVLRYVAKSSLNDETFSLPSFQRRKSTRVITTRLFEDFFVLGIEKQDLESHIKKNPTKTSGTLTPKILFNYPNDTAACKEPPRNSVPDFAFPFGVRAHKIKLESSFNPLEEIIYSSTHYNLQSNCFVFPLLSSPLGYEDTKMNDIIEASNSNHLFYMVCLSFDDFFDMSTKNPKTSLDDMNYWQVKKIICFMTYYPFMSFFFDSLLKILEILKFERIVKLNQADSNDLNRFDIIDAIFTNSFIETVVKGNLTRLWKSMPPKFGETLEFEFQSNQMKPRISLKLGNEAQLYTLEALWACSLVFNYITLKDLLWLFGALMLEKKIVFLSKNIYLLTATLSVIRSLIKPFKYPFPLIYNLPELLMVLCDAPGAALIGINKGEDYFRKEDLFDNYPSCIYVCLDEEIVYMEPGPGLDLPRFDDFEKNLVTHYSKLNQDLSYQMTLKSSVSSDHSHATKKRELKYFTNDQEKIACIQVLEIFKTTLQDKIIKYIPEEPLLTNQQLDYERIKEIVLKKINSADKPFFKQFLGTQIFTYYLEQHYQLE